MARVTNALLQGARGKVGNLVFSTRNGKTQIRIAPTRSANSRPTTAQKRVLSNFKAGVNYGKLVMANPELKKLYEAQRDHKGRSAYNLAVRDACRPPIVRSIHTEKYHGLPGDEIYIHAVDDFMVKSVLVTIKDDDGNVLEQGEAIQSGLSLDWVYEAKLENPHPRGCTIRATARDLPGNEGSHELTI